jgi:hypothetical protein
MTDKSVNLSITSIVSARDGKPYVCYSYGDFEAQMTPEEACRHAYYLIEAAQAALCDGFLLEFMRTEIKAPDEHITGLLRDFREFRDRRRQEVEGG